MRVVFFAAAITICALTTSHATIAQNLDNDGVNLLIGFESKPSDNLPMFVFVKGKLSGIAPGIITLPSQETVPVEIGVAQLNQSPLYSFTFDSSVLKAKKLNVVITNIGSTFDFKAVILNKDAIKTLPLVRIRNNVYAITLPSASYLKIENFQNDHKIVEALPVKKAEDYGFSSHLIYDKSEQGVVPLGSSSSWSGTNMIVFSRGGIGYFPERQKWTIQSKPEGADIYTDSHPGRPVGKTNSTVEVTEFISSYAILKMDGYQQCVIHMDDYQQCTEKDCSRSEGVDGSVTFTCTLKKIQ